MVSELRNPRFLRNRRSSGSSNSNPVDTSLFDGLSEEEVVEILRRLPLKLANQCKCVSKTWLNLISSTHFAKSYLRFHHHNNSSITPPQFAIVHRYRGLVGPGLFRVTPSYSSSAACGGLVKLTLAPPTLERNVVPVNDPSYIDYQFLAPSNGWVLCSFPDPSGECYYVVNPLTKHEIALPPIPRTSDKLSRVGFIFCVDVDDSNTSTSFRVVRFPPSDKIGGTSLELDIFISETREWIQSTLLFSSDRTAKSTDVYDCPLNDHAVALNGKLHWLHVWFAREIFVYDPYTQEKYHRLSLPGDCLGLSLYCLGTCQCEGQGGSSKHLKYSESHDAAIRVWELKDYDKVEWCLLHRVSFSGLTCRVPRIKWPPFWNETDSYPAVVAFHPWDRDLVLCKHGWGLFLLYNLRLKSLELFREWGQGVKFDNGMPSIYFLFELPWWPTPAPYKIDENLFKFI